MPTDWDYTVHIEPSYLSNKSGFIITILVARFYNKGSVERVLGNGPSWQMTCNWESGEG